MNQSTEAYWGYHLILDLTECNQNSRYPNKEKIYQFAKQLVRDIDMVAYGEPQVIHFGPDGKQGYTLVQLIETSNIIGHFNDDTGEGYLDVFSCKIFDVDVVKKLVTEYFQPKKIRTTYLIRQA